MKKKCPLVMLSTEKAIEGQLYLHNEVLRQLNKSFADALNRRDSNSTSSVKAQHLYILSDDEIKEGDWYYHPEIAQEYTIIHKNVESIGLHPTQGVFQWKNTTNEWYKKAKKIIATTNPELWISNKAYKSRGSNETVPYKEFIPKISLDFVEAYIKAYNKGQMIKEVMVEYTYEFRKSQGGSDRTAVIKVSSNGTISITSIEERKYTLQEVSDLLASEYDNYLNYLLDNNRSSTKGEKYYLSFKDWFNKNY